MSLLRQLYVFVLVWCISVCVFVPRGVQSKRKKIPVNGQRGVTGDNVRDDAMAATISVNVYKSPRRSGSRCKDCEPTDEQPRETDNPLSATDKLQILRNAKRARNSNVANPSHPKLSTKSQRKGSEIVNKNAARIKAQIIEDEIERHGKKKSSPGKFTKALMKQEKRLDKQLKKNDKKYQRLQKTIDENMNELVSNIPEASYELHSSENKTDAGGKKDLSLDVSNKSSSNDFGMSISILVRKGSKIDQNVGMTKQRGKMPHKLQNGRRSGKKEKENKRARNSGHRRRRPKLDDKTTADQNADQKLKQNYKSDTMLKDDTRYDPNRWNSYRRPGGRQSRNRQGQRISSTLNRNYRQLMQHLNGMMERFYGAMQEVDYSYNYIFNMTREDLMMGARNIFEEIHESNDYIYDAVMKATHFAREVHIKNHKNRDAELRGKHRDQPIVMAESPVKRKDFQPHFQESQMEERKVQEQLQTAKIMKRDCMQEESRLQQVRERYRDSYDRVAIRDLFDNLNTTILLINRGFHMSPQLKALDRQKAYLDSGKEYIITGESMVRSCRELLYTGLTKMRENYEMYNKWKAERRNRNGSQSGSQSNSRSSLSRRRHRQLQVQVSQAQRHVTSLKTELNRLERMLIPAIEEAAKAMAREGEGAEVIFLKTKAIRLKTLTQEMYTALDLIRVFIGSETKIVYPSMCKQQVEGSGYGDVDDEGDLDCLEEGSGSEESDSDKMFVTDDEDFTFTGEPAVIRKTGIPPVKQLGLDLIDYTSKLLRDSQNIYDETRPLQRSLEGLNQKWSGIESKVSTTERALQRQKDLLRRIDDNARDVEDVRAKIRQVLHTVKKLKEVDLVYALERAKEALERAKKYSEGNRQPPSELTRKEDKEEGEKEVEETSEEEKPEKPTEEKEEDKETEKVDKEDDFDYNALFNTGREIMSNEEDIQFLRSVALKNCGKIGSHLTNIRGNMSMLQRKVEMAREMLASMQMSMSKSGPGYVPVPIPPTHQKADLSLSSSISVCMKPTSLDGTVLVVAGNNSASYSVSLDSGEITVTVYDKDNDDLGSVTLDTAIVTDKWCTLSIERNAQTMTVTASTQEGESETKSEEVSSLGFTQLSPVMAYIGNVPDSLGISGDSWEGCIGELSVDGQALSFFRTDSEGNQPTPCSDHCVKKGQRLSTVFSGDGYVHFHRPVREAINMISFRFRTRQAKAALFSLKNKAQRFYLSVVMINGALRLESSSRVENVVLQSLNSSLNDGNSHSLKIVYRGSRTYPELDGDRATFSVEKARPQILHDVLPGVLIGAFVSTDHKFVNGQYRPLIGCLGNVFIDDNKLLLPDAAQVYNAYQGHCESSSTSTWHSCWRWTDNSKLLSFGELENSNTIAVLVSKDALGPLLYYAKEDSYEIEVSMTEDGIDVSSEESEGVILRPEGSDNYFTIVTITDDGTEVSVKAWDQGVEISYGGFWGFANTDLDKPHTVAIGETRDGEDRMFTGSLAQFTVGDRLLDLSQYATSHNLKPCERPLGKIKLLKPQEDLEEPFTCS